MQPSNQELLEGASRTLRLSEDLHRHFSPQLDRGRVINVSPIAVADMGLSPSPSGQQQASRHQELKSQSGRPVLPSLERPAGISLPQDDTHSLNRNSDLS